jgi:hypothetical protein
MHLQKTILLLLFLSISLYISAKGKWNIGLGTTHGYNNSDLSIWEYKVEKTMSHGIYFKMGYEFRIYKSFSIAILPGFMQHYDEISINETNIETFSYNFDLPIDIYYFIKKWRLKTGISIQDYRVSEEFALERSYNARLNLNLGLSYHFYKNWAAEVGFSTILSDKINSLLIRNYPNHFSIGMLYRFNWKGKRND